MTVRDIEALVFDQYSTIVDMQTGLVEAVTPFLAAKGWDGEPNRFVTWWRRTHFENSMIDALCEGGYTRTARSAGARCRTSWTGVASTIRRMRRPAWSPRSSG